MLSVLTTINLFVLAKFSFGEIIVWDWLVVSQLISLVGTTLLCLSFLLSSRLGWLENLFGGLDKVYKIHHIAGGLAFVMLLHHPLFLVVKVLPRVDLATKYFWFSNLPAYNFGIAALYLMLLLLILTLLVNLPYDLWLKTHEYMGVALVFAAIHVLTISSDVSRYLPLRYWMTFWLIVSMVAVIYKLLLYRLISPKYRYVVESTRVIGEVVEVWLKPINKEMKYYPGQFAFVTFEKMGKESHPFSISSSGFDGRVRLSMKRLGDYTLKLNSLVAGDLVTLFGPYGKFFESLLGKKDLVWIAGGIGITPYMGMIDLAQKWNRQRVDLIYCAKNEAELIFDEEIRSKVGDGERVKYHRFCSDENGRLSAKSILDLVGSFQDKKFLLCGPSAMMESLTSQLVGFGVKRRNVIFEDFNFK